MGVAGMSRKYAVAAVARGAGHLVEAQPAAEFAT